jgi:hypothetical protein
VKKNTDAAPDANSKVHLNADKSEYTLLSLHKNIEQKLFNRSLESVTI